VRLPNVGEVRRVRALAAAVAAVVWLAFAPGALVAMFLDSAARAGAVVGLLEPSFVRSPTRAADVNTSITVGGASVPVTLGAGEKAFVTFSGTTGEHLGLGLTGVSIPCCSTTLKLMDPSGAQVFSTGVGSSDTAVNFPKLLSTGTYTIVLDPGGSAGSVTFTLSDDLVASITIGGSSPTVTIARAGQNERLTFTGAVGEHLGLGLTGVSIPCCSSQVRLLFGPDDTQVYFTGFGSSSTGIDFPTLTSAGTYTIVVDPGPNTGSVTLTLSDDLQATIAPDAPPVTATIGRAGQNERLSFDAHAGDYFTVLLSGDTFPCCSSLLKLLDPSGTQVYFNGFSPVTTSLTLPRLGADGSYTLIVDPSADTGAVTLTLQRNGMTLSQSYGTCLGSGLNALAPSVCTADPVNSLTGAFTTSADDLSLASIGVSFDFVRSYTSADAASGRLGPGWTDNYSASLAVQPNGDVLLHGEDGQRVYFTKQADGSFVGAAGTLSTLTTITGGYKLVRHDQVAYQFDSSGVLQSELDRNGQGLTFGYDGSGRLTAVTDAAGHVVSVGYNASNLISSVSTPDGRSVAYGYTNGRLTSVTLPDPDGAGPLTSPVWTYTYDAGGRLWQVIDPDQHTQATNVYDPATGRVTQQTDANNKTTTFAWDPATQTATITDPDNHVWKDVYQTNLLIKRIDPAGETTQLGHDLSLDTNAVTAPNGTDTTAMVYQNGNLMTATAPASLGGVQKQFTYDAQNNVKTVTDARSKLTHYGYDPAGNNNSVTLDGQQVFGATYNAQGQMLTSTDGNGKQTTYTYDTAGNVASVTAPDPDGGGPLAASKTTYTYDALGNVLTKVDPLGNCSGCTPANYRTAYTYDANGHLLTETDPLGHTTTYTYDAAGNTATVTDAKSHTTTYGYDSANHLTRVTGPDPDGNGPLEAPVTTYSYDDAGNRVTMVGPRGNCSGCNPASYTTTYTYDQNNRLASVTTPKGEKTTYTYDSNGDLASVVDPRGNVQGANPDDYRTSYSYDAAGRLLTTTDPLGHVTTNHYDAVGNLDWTKDANLHQTSYTYDAAGRILTVTAPDGGLTTNTYDGNGSLLTRKDDNNHTTTYTYDDAGRLTQITGPDPDGGGPLPAPVTSYSYDLNGNRSSMTDPNGNATQTGGDGTTTYSYDHANRLTGIGYSDTTPAVSFGYDNVGNRTAMSDGSGSISYVYDNLNRLTSLTRGSDTFSYAYDVAGNLTSRTYPDSTQTTYGYDEDDRLTSATSSGNATSYSYYANSELNQTTLPSGNGYVETRVYDNAGRLTEVKNAKGASVLSDYVSTLDPAGNPTQIVQTGAVNATQTYSYDANDRILSVCFQAGTCPNAGDPKITWTYDKIGNRLTETRATTTTTYSYNGGDELTQASAQNTGTNPYSSQVQTDGAQPYWRLGETSGTSFASTVGSYTGTWTGSPTLGVTGALTGDTNTAVTLNGTNQYGNVPNASGLGKTNNFSLELWVKRTKNASLQAVAGKPLTTTTKSENYAFWFDTANKIRFEVGNGTKSQTLTSAAALDTNWHHVVATFASGAIKLYVDGTLSASVTATFTTAATNTSTFDLGRSGTSNYYGGSLDEIALYGSALTATQIADHYTKGINAPLVTAYSYDTNGNQTAAGATTLTYDLANRLKTLAAGGTTTTYSYDGDGNRLQASTGSLASQKTNYLWDTNALGGLPQLALERDGNNTLLRRYTYGNRRISMTTGGNTYYYHYDPLGSVVNLTSATGTSEWTDSYEPYGPIHTETKNDPNAPANLFKFAGEYNDPTGLYYLRARQYDSGSARFTRPDPARPALSHGLNSAYVYVDDRPTAAVDPSGETLVPSDAAEFFAQRVTQPVDAVGPAEGIGGSYDVVSAVGTADGAGPPATRGLYAYPSATTGIDIAANLPPVNPSRFKPDWGKSRLCSVDLGCTGDENYIIFKESTWRPYAQNGQFFGLGQLSIDARYRYLPRHPNTTDPIYQLYAMKRYIRERYVTEDAAVTFRKAHGYY
jgi:RHS repeat-associated protein